MKLVSPDALTDLQRSTFEGNRRFLPTGAVCVNVMLGQEAWDLRPLLLIAGKVNLVRFSMPLPESVARSLVAELEGFSVLHNSHQRVQLLPAEGRCMLLRPFFPSTLKDDIEGGKIASAQQRVEILHDLIRIVSDLARRSVAHGHISPSNIVLEGGKIALIDPMIGALHQTGDSYLAPEAALGQLPNSSCDLYGLGRIIKILLGDTLSSRQETLVQQLTLSAPRQRPPLEEVISAFTVRGCNDFTGGEERPARLQTTSGRVLRSVQAACQEPTSRDLPPEFGQGTKRPRQFPFAGQAALIAISSIAAMVFVKDRYPALYFELTSRLPMLAAQHSVEYETEWMSRDRARMAVVGRAGVIRREPAAINTIVNDLLAGANPDGVNGPLLRVALEDSWRGELSPADKHAALVFSLINLVPEGQAYIPALSTLHPGVILAILGQTTGTPIPRELSQMPIDSLLRLPAPFGDLFAQVKAMSIGSLGDPTVIGLAAIVTGNAHARAFESFLGVDMQPAQTLARVSLIAPRVGSDPLAATELLGVLGDRGGDITTLVGWFDLIEVAGWSSVQSADKLSLILGNMPQAQLGTPLLADLLTFPLEKVRHEAMVKLRDILGGADSERLLVTLSTPTLGLSREQTIALVSALSLPPPARAPFIPAWFALNPSADAVLLILLARSTADPSDLLNLEAARYLRRSSWTASADILKLLSSHPEPLARVLAYGRLDPNVDEDRSILLERKLREKDESCLRMVQERLNSLPPKISRP